MRKLKITAMVMFESGPAIATTASPHFCPNISLRKLYGLKGTGFAHPTTKPEFDKISVSGNKIEPKISI